MHEIDFLINIFFENGYNKSELIKIANNYLDRVQKIPTTQESDKHQFVKLPGYLLLVQNFVGNLENKISELYSHQLLI